MLGRKFLNNAYPFYRGLLNINTGAITICLPTLKLSAVNMQLGDIYVINTLNEVNLKHEMRLNYLDYQLIESDEDFKNQFELFKKFVQEEFSKEKTMIKLKIQERLYIYNNLNINAILIE